MPTPELPSSTAVCPGAKLSLSAASPSPVTAETTCTGTPSATASISALRASQSAHRSALVSTTTGEAPLSQAVAR